VSDDVIRRRLREVLDVEPPDPTLRARVMASLPLDLGEENHGRRWLAGGLAMLLATTIVAGLLLSRTAREASPKTAGQYHSNLVTIGSAQVIAPTDLHCRLPLASTRGGLFLGLPDGQLGLDPTNTSDAGMVRGNYVAGRWIAASPQMAPDGTAYAYASSQKLQTAPYLTAAIHVVDTTTGSDRVIWQGDGVSVSVIGFGSGVVYATAYAANNEANATIKPGLWSFDTRAGGLRRVQVPDDRTRYSGVHDGGVWGVPSSGGLRRLDLATGAVTDYPIGAGAMINVMGFDRDGLPLVRVTSVSVKPGAASSSPNERQPVPIPTVQPAALYVVTRQGDPILMTSDPALVNSVPVADQHGVWLAGSDGSVWLYQQRSGLRKVAQIDPALLGGRVSVAGSCL
jgi:hypothetical protein